MTAEGSGLVFIPERVEECRREAGGIRNIDIVNATGATAKHISGVMTGKSAVSYRLGLKIAAMLGVTVGYLTGAEDAPVMTKRSESSAMFVRIMSRLAVENPDLVLHLRDLDKDIAGPVSGDLHILADQIVNCIRDFIHTEGK